MAVPSIIIEVIDVHDTENQYTTAISFSPDLNREMVQLILEDVAKTLKEGM